MCVCVYDPEDLYLMHSMYKLVDYSVKDQNSGVFELQVTSRVKFSMKIRENGY